MIYFWMSIAVLLFSAVNTKCFLYAKQKYGENCWKLLEKVHMVCTALPFNKVMIVCRGLNEELDPFLPFPSPSFSSIPLLFDQIQPTELH